MIDCEKWAKDGHLPSVSLLNDEPRVATARWIVTSRRFEVLTPASSKWPFDSQNGGHLSPEKVTYGSKRGHFQEPGIFQSVEWVVSTHSVSSLAPNHTTVFCCFQFCRARKQGIWWVNYSNLPKFFGRKCNFHHKRQQVPVISELFQPVPIRLTFQAPFVLFPSNLDPKPEMMMMISIRTCRVTPRISCKVLFGSCWKEKPIPIQLTSRWMRRHWWRRVEKMRRVGEEEDGEGPFPQWDFQGPPRTWDPLPILFPYHSHFRIPNLFG